MASSDPELKDGFTLPVWMKTKPTKDFEPFATSPPAPEDSFFFIRYPNKDKLYGKTNIDSDLNTLGNQTTELSSAVYNYKEKDWSRHTKPCQDVIHGIAPINTTVNLPGQQKSKSAGSDDEFKGEGAACGSSVVKVATQMISSTRSPRGFTVASPSDDIDLDSADIQRRLAMRRGSRSLPTTPVHSPKSSPTSRRKNNGNRYFTSPFEPVEDSKNRSWLTMALLGFKKDLTTSTSTLAEEDVLENRLHVTLAESVESLGPAPKGVPPKVLLVEATQQPKLAKPASTFRPKPSELREMNFWSPTSM